ncbi:MAG: hypothetical protein IPI49_00305 [Myxococcales bacterium]|nr:hypothetical protein [Myxococcales bacterium]
MLKRRLYGNKTERSGTSELQLALGDLLAGEAQLQKELNKKVQDATEAAPPDPEGKASLVLTAGATCPRASCPVW